MPFRASICRAAVESGTTKADIFYPDSELPSNLLGIPAGAEMFVRSLSWSRNNSGTVSGGEVDSGAMTPKSLSHLHIQSKVPDNTLLSINYKKETLPGELRRE